jgi:hypothetical protein
MVGLRIQRDGVMAHDSASVQQHAKQGQDTDDATEHCPHSLLSNRAHLPHLLNCEVSNVAFVASRGCACPQ